LAHAALQQFGGKCSPFCTGESEVHVTLFDQEVRVTRFGMKQPEGLHERVAEGCCTVIVAPDAIDTNTIVVKDSEIFSEVKLVDGTPAAAAALDADGRVLKERQPPHAACSMPIAASRLASADDCTPKLVKGGLAAFQGTMPHFSPGSTHEEASSTTLDEPCCATASSPHGMLDAHHTRNRQVKLVATIVKQAGESLRTDPSEAPLDGDGGTLECEGGIPLCLQLVDSRDSSNRLESADVHIPGREIGDVQ
jgi:hypothetical protein